MVIKKKDKEKEGEIECKSGTILFPKKETKNFFHKIRKIKVPFIKKVVVFFGKNKKSVGKLPVASIEAGSGEIFFVVREEAKKLSEELSDGDKVRFSTKKANKGKQRFAFDVKVTIKKNNVGGKK